MDEVQVSLTELNHLLRGAIIPIRTPSQVQLSPLTGSQADHGMCYLEGDTDPDHTCPISGQSTQTYDPLGTGTSTDARFGPSGHHTGRSLSSSQSQFSSEVPFTHQSHLAPLVDSHSRPSLLQDHRGPPHGLKAKILPKPWSPSSISLPPFSSVPYSGHAAESEDEDDIDLLAPSVVTAPWDKMLSLAEVARLRADGQIFPDDGQLLSNATDEETRQARNHPFDYDTPKEDSRKRRRSGIGDHKTQPEIPSSSPWQSHTHASQDPVELGLCTLQRGKQLFDL